MDNKKVFQLSVRIFRAWERFHPCRRVEQPQYKANQERSRYTDATPVLHTLNVYIVFNTLAV